MDKDNLFGRAEAVRQIEPFMGKPFIKVITGVRRCGKSSILLLLARRLREAGVSDDRIIFINFEDLDYAELGSYKELYAFVKSKMGARKGYYVFLDEVQEVQGWERAVNSLLSGRGAATRFLLAS
jgi:predicted AAA+ superfamily ATPase